MISLQTAIHDAKSLVNRVLEEGNAQVYIVVAHGSLAVAPEPFEAFRLYPSEEPENHVVTSDADVDAIFQLPQVKAQFDG